MREIALFRLVVYRFIEVKELADHGMVADVFGYGAEAVILGNAADVVLAVVLAQGFVVPCYAFPYIPSVQLGLLHNLVKRSPHSDEFLLCHATIRWRSVAVLLFVS